MKSFNFFRSLRSSKGAFVAGLLALSLGLPAFSQQVVVTAANKEAGQKIVAQLRAAAQQELNQGQGAVALTAIAQLQGGTVGGSSLGKAASDVIVAVKVITSGKDLGRLNQILGNVNRSLYTVQTR